MYIYIYVYIYIYIYDIVLSTITWYTAIYKEVDI